VIRETMLYHIGLQHAAADGPETRMRPRTRSGPLLLAFVATLLPVILAVNHDAGGMVDDPGPRLPVGRGWYDELPSACSGGPFPARQRMMPLISAGSAPEGTGTIGEGAIAVPVARGGEHDAPRVRPRGGAARAGAAPGSDAGRGARGGRSVRGGSRLSPLAYERGGGRHGPSIGASPEFD